MTERPIIIIGSGLAGYGLAREFRKLDQETPLTIITADSGHAYAKPMLSTALTKGKDADSLPNADADATAKQLNANILTQTRVNAIDADNHCVTTNNQTLNYSKLVLALGADPFRPPLAGDAVDDVLSVNDLDDYRRFRNALDGKNSVAILGGGLIGCEFANDLANQGIKVDVIDRNNGPLARLLPAPLSNKLQDALESLGVVWHGEKSADSVTRNGDGYQLTLTDGSTLDADVVLSAIGLRSRTTLAEQAGIQVNRGIVVDRYLQSSDADIYALGDCAEVEGLVLPFIAPILKASKALAPTLAGEPAAVAYPAMPVILKTPAYPISLLPPPADVNGEWRIEESDDACRALYYDESETLRGFVLGGSAAMEGNKLALGVPALIASD